MKDNVKTTLDDLIHYRKPTDEIKKALMKFNRNDIVDIPDELILQKADVFNVIQLFLNKKIEAQELSNWAELVEGRDGITYEDIENEDRISIVLSWLSSPEISGELTNERVKEYIKYLHDGK